MVRDFEKHPPHSPEALFSASQAPTPSSPLFWLRLLSRRPWVLLGSLWLVTVCLAAMASHRLLFTDPGKGTKPPMTRSSVVSSKDSSGSSSPLGDSSDAHQNGDRDAVRARHRTKVTLWGLSSLVGLCALGSVVISQRAKASASRPPQRRVRRVKAKTKAKAKLATGPKRLQPYSPQRDAVIVKGAQAITDTLALTMVDAETDPAPAMQTRVAVPDQAQPTMASKPTEATVTRGHREPQAINLEANARVEANADGGDQADPRPPQAEVVPPDETHPLDWTEDSLAHVLDLRQRRSLSSLM